MVTNTTGMQSQVHLLSLNPVLIPHTYFRQHNLSLLTVSSKSYGILIALLTPCLICRIVKGHG